MVSVMPNLIYENNQQFSLYYNLSFAAELFYIRMKKFLLTRLGRDSFIHKPITRNLSFQNNWDGSHILYRKKTIHENVHFIQEKYFEFSWNLANIYFITVHIKNILRILSSLIEDREKAKN